MRNKIGNFCMGLGTVLVLAALFLFLWNVREDSRAGLYAEDILPRIMSQIEDAGDEGPKGGTFDTAMTETEIDGYAYVGCLSIPALDLELPVMSEWDYARLKIAPCRYAGSTKTGDLVICAHNYSRHFGPIRNLTPGDTVYFVDMDGAVWQYAVETVDILAPTDVEEMTAGDYALTLFTCTYGGKSRVTVRCRRAAEEEGG